MKNNPFKSQTALEIFQRYAVSAAYLFGSAARGDERKDSDIDIAILLPTNLSKEKRFKTRLLMMADLSRMLHKNIDLIILNDMSSLFFKYAIIKEGILLYEKNEDDRIDFENRILDSYFDFQPFLTLYNKQYVKNNI